MIVGLNPGFMGPTTQGSIGLLGPGGFSAGDEEAGICVGPSLCLSSTSGVFESHSLCGGLTLVRYHNFCISSSIINLTFMPKRVMPIIGFWSKEQQSPLHVWI